MKVRLRSREPRDLIGRNDSKEELRLIRNGLGKEMEGESELFRERGVEMS